MKKKNKNKKVQVKLIFDDYIIAKDIILIDDEKKLIGNFTKLEALELARSKQKNLIQIHSNSSIESTCVICEINKYKYEVNKKTKPVTNKKIKEVRVTAKSDLTDLLRSLDQCCDFILQKHLSVILILKSYRRNFIGKDAFIINYIESHGQLSYSIQKSPRPNLLKLYVTRKTNKSKMESKE
jgi:translation initiation factor IF-3